MNVPLNSEGSEFKQPVVTSQWPRDCVQQLRIPNYALSDTQPIRGAPSSTVTSDEIRNSKWFESQPTQNLIVQIKVMQQKLKKRIFSWSNSGDSEDHSYKRRCERQLLAKKLHLCLPFNPFEVAAATRATVWTWVLDSALWPVSCMSLGASFWKRLSFSSAGVNNTPQGTSSPAPAQRCGWQGRTDGVCFSGGPLLALRVQGLRTGWGLLMLLGSVKKV